MPVARKSPLLVIALLMLLQAEAPAVATAGADLVVTKTANPDPASVRRKLTYTITVTNLGPDSAEGVTLTDQFQVNSGVAPGEPRNYRFRRASTKAGSCDRYDAEGTVTCRLGNLSPGASVAVRLTLTPLQDGVISNTAYAFSETFSDDPDLANNQTRIVTTILR
jgi:uncharacterized repeat protein (TIGR01451 family)